MNGKIIAFGGILIIIVFAVIALVSNSSKPSQTQRVTVPKSTTSQTNAAQTIPTATSQNPQDVVAGLYPNQIKNTATTPGFSIGSLMVENNTDQNGNPVSDHLQFTLKNLTQKDLTNFEMYYTITDQTTHQKEGYYRKLTNFVLPAGSSKTLNFDNKQGAGHYPVNTHSLYFTSTNPLLFQVMVSSPGYKVETAQVTKAAGGAETKD